MGTKYKTVGGTGTGLGQDFSHFLQNGLNSGTFGSATAGSQFAGANPVGQTQGIASVLNSLFSGGAGQFGGALQQMLQTQQTNDINGIRARFGVGGGTAFGTPGQYAESTYRAQAAPQITNAIGQLQLQGLQTILPYIGNFAGRDIPQAETAAQENPWLTAAKLGIGAGSTIAGLMGGGPALAGIFNGAAGGIAGAQPGQPGYTGGFGGMFQVPQNINLGYPGGNFSGSPMNLPFGTMTFAGSPSFQVPRY